MTLTIDHTQTCRLRRLGWAKGAQGHKGHRVLLYPHCLETCCVSPKLGNPVARRRTTDVTPSRDDPVVSSAWSGQGGLQQEQADGGGRVNR